MAAPQFKVGDVVVHKASGTKAVIYHVVTECKTHADAFCCHNADDCVRVKTDVYAVHLDFGDTTEHRVPGYLLRQAKSD